MLLHRMYVLTEQECEFLANMPKMSYARLIKMLLNLINTFFTQKMVIMSEYNRKNSSVFQTLNRVYQYELKNKF